MTALTNASLKVTDKDGNTAVINGVSAAMAKKVSECLTQIGQNTTDIKTNADAITAAQQDIENLNQSLTTDVVHIAGAETITGVKTFGAAPIVPTQASSDNSQKAASTAFVKAAISSSGIIPSGVSVNDIGVAGERGFGVGICPDSDAAAALGYLGMDGYADPGSDNYGNYMHIKGGVFVWIPRFWVRYGNQNAPQYELFGTNSIEIKPASAYDTEELAEADNFFCPRGFTDGGVMKDGVFVAKYRAAYTNGVALSSSANVAGTREITAAVMIDYARTLSEYGLNVQSCFIRSIYELICLAHGQMVKWTTYCKWYDSTLTANYPKSSWATTNIGLYTHNGQANGITATWYVWELALGITTAGTSGTTGQTQVASDDIYLLKPEKKLADFTSGFGAETDAWGTEANLVAGMYDKYTCPYPLTTSLGTYRWGNEGVAVFVNPYAEDEDTRKCNRELFGIVPNGSAAVSANGANLIANSKVYTFPVTTNLAFFMGGQTVSGTNDERPFARHFNSWRTYSTVRHGFRLAGYV